METITESTEESTLRNRKLHRKGKSSNSVAEELETENAENKQKLQCAGSDEPEKLKSHPSPTGQLGDRESVKSDNEPRFVIRVQLDGASVVLFVLSFVTRFFRLTHPNGVV